MLPQSSLHVATSSAPSPPAAISVAWLPSKGNWVPFRMLISFQPSPLAARSSSKAKTGERERGFTNNLQRFAYNTLLQVE